MLKLFISVYFLFLFVFFVFDSVVLKKLILVIFFYDYFFYLCFLVIVEKLIIVYFFKCIVVMFVYSFMRIVIGVFFIKVWGFGCVY